MANEAEIDEKSMGPNEINAAAKDEGDSFITCEEGNENSGNLSEEVMNDVEEEEEAPQINQVFRSSKRKSRKANVESDGDGSKGYDFACATTAEGKGEEVSQTRARKRSKYLSYPYYTDGYLKFIAKDSKIPKQLRECIAQEDSKISKLSSGRKFNRKPCKNSFDSSNESEVINMSCHDLLSLLQMAAIDSHHPNKTKSLDSTKVFFSMFRKSVFHDESSIGLSSMNTIQQMDVPESSVAVRKPCSFDLSSPKVLALYSPRYLAHYSPKTLVAPSGGKTRKATGISRKDAIFYPSVANKTNYPGLSSPIDKSEPKRRNRKQEITMDKPEPKKRNRTTRPKLMSLNDVATESADFAKLNNLESISLVLDMPIDPEPRNDEKKSDTLLSMNTDLGSVIGAVDGIIVEDGKKELPSEEKSGRKRRGRRKKSLIACQTSCATDVQNLNQNVVQTISQGQDAPKDKRGRKKRVIEQNAVMNHQNGTSDYTYLNRNEAEPVSLGNEAEPVLMDNEAEPLSMRSEREPLSLRNEANTISLKSDAKLVSLENEVEPGLLGNEAEQLSLGTEAELGSVENVAKVVLPGNHLPEAKQEMMKKSYPVSCMPPLSIVKQNLQTMTTMLAKTSDKVPEEMKTKLKEKIERLIVKVNTREGSSSLNLGL